MQRNVILGSEFILYDIDQRPIAYSKNTALSLKNNLIDVTNKDSKGWSEQISGSRDFNISFEGLVSHDNEFGLDYFTDKMINGEPFFIKFGVNQNSFDYSYWGEVAIESIDINGEYDGVVSYEGKLKGVGELIFTNEGSPVQSGFLKVEDDPIFRGSAAFNITNQNKVNWNNAFDKTFQSIEFSTSNNTTTLWATLRDGSKYSSAFVNSGASGSGEITALSFNTHNGTLKVNNLTTSLDGRYQTIGDYVSNTFLSSNYYSKMQSDDRFYLKTNPDMYLNKVTADSLYSGTGHTHTFASLTNKPTTISGYGISDAYTKVQADGRYIQSETDTLDSVLGRGNSSSKNVYLSGDTYISKQLSIPTVVPSTVVTGKHYIYSTESYGGTGSTVGGGGEITTLNFNVGNGNLVVNNLSTSLDGRYSVLSHTHTFASLTSRPTTIVGFGITDAYTKTETDSKYSSLAHTHSFATLTAKPTTLIGYGITDAQPFITSGTTAQYYRGDKTFQPLNTTAVIEGTNLYYSNARVKTYADTLYSGLAHTHTFASLTSRPTTIGGYGISDAYTKAEADNRYLQSETDTLDSVLGRGNTSGKNINLNGDAYFSKQLSIPTVVPGTLVAGKHYIYSTDIYGGTGSTAGGGGVSYYKDLADVSLFNVANGQSPVWNSTIQKWENKNISVDLSPYALKTGVGSTGIWPIGVTGNAATTTTLQTARTIWGQSFNGSANITGALTSVTDITGTGIADFARFYGNSADLVTAPSFSFTNNSNTGMWNVSFNTLGFTTAGINRLTVGTASVDSTLPIKTPTLNGGNLVVDNNVITSGNGLSLYAGAPAPAGTMPTYGIAFAGTASFGTHGAVTADWATYLTMTTAGRGWIFKGAATGTGSNVASIGINGVGTFAGVVAPNLYGALNGTVILTNNNNFNSAPFSFVGKNSGTDNNLYTYSPTGVKLALNIGDGSTLNNSISGNATTATNWGAYTNQLGVIPAMDFAFGRNANNVIAPVSQAVFSGWLGLGTNAYSSTPYLPLTAGSSFPLTAPLYINTAGGVGLTVKNTTGAIGNNYIQYLNNAGTRLGYVGFGSTTVNTLLLSNDLGANSYNATSHVFNSDINGTNLTMSSNVNALAFRASGVSGSIRGYGYSTVGNLRWLTYADASVESTGNLGSNWNLASYNDAGAFLRNNIVIARATGVMTLNGDAVNVTNKLAVNWPNASPIAQFSNYMGGNTTVPSAQFVAEHFGLSVATQATSNTYYAFTVGGGTTNVGGGGNILFRVGADGTTYLNGAMSFRPNIISPFLSNSISIGKSASVWPQIDGFGNGTRGFTLSTELISGSYQFELNKGGFNVAGGSNINGALTTSGNITSPKFISTGTGFKTTNFQGMVGDYDQNTTADKIIWTIGDNWNTIASMYGFGYQYNSKYVSSQHQIVFRTAGTVTSSISLTTGNAYFDGTVTAPKIKVSQNLSIPTAPPISPEAGTHYIYSTN